MFLAEYNPRAKTFVFTKTVFLQDETQTFGIVRKDEPCRDAGECLKKLGTAAENALLDGFKFDVKALRLMDEPEQDEKWSSELVPPRRPRNRTSKPAVKARDKH